LKELKIESVYLGINDGKKEALYKNDFEKYFFDYNGIYEKALAADKFLIMGKKGSGKTILAEYIRKISESDSQWFCEVRSYKLNFRT
jgi:ABC-type lipoprotein export system ATPase subunit